MITYSLFICNQVQANNFVSSKYCNNPNENISTYATYLEAEKNLSRNNGHGMMVITECVESASLEIIQNVANWENMIRHSARKKTNIFKTLKRIDAKWSKRGIDISGEWYNAHMKYFMRGYGDDPEYTALFESYEPPNPENTNCMNRGYKDKNLVWHAAYFGDIDAVKWLVEEKGADVNNISCQGFTVADAAMNNGHLHIVDYIINRPEFKYINRVSPYRKTLLVFLYDIRFLPSEEIQQYGIYTKGEMRRRLIAKGAK